MKGQYGRMSAERIVDAILVSQGPSLEQNYLALAARKPAVLPVVLQRLREGKAHEKRMMTKILRYVGWPEAVPTLIGIIESDTEHPLARIGSTYALGAIGDESAGPALLGVLRSPNRSVTEKGVAIASLARIGHREAVPAIRPYATDANIRMRIIAVRALAELGQKPDTKTLFEAVESNDYVVREEACAALGVVGGVDAMATLKTKAATDPHRAVRSQAGVALLSAEMIALPTTERIGFLEQSLADQDKQVRRWAVSTLATRCGEEGRSLLRKKAQQDSATGQVCRSTLLLLEGAAPRFRGRY